MKEKIIKIVILPVGPTIRMEVFYETHTLVVTNIFQKQALLNVKKIFQQVWREKDEKKT